MSESDDGRVRRWAGQRAKRREALMRGGLAAVAEYGAGTTAERIADHANVRRPQLYRYFTDTTELHEALVAYIGELLTERLAEALIVGGDSAAELIDRAVGVFVDWLLAHWNWYDYVIARSQDGVAAGVRTGIGASVCKLLIGYGSVYGGDLRMAEPCAFALVSMVESATSRWLANPGEITRDELVAQLAGWCWGVIEQLLAAQRVSIDPDRPLPPLTVSS